MDAKTLFLILVGGVAIVWVIIAISNFVGLKSMFQFVGTPAVFGIAIMIFGMGLYYFIQPYLGK